MSVSHIKAALRQLVRSRAGGVCEYCLLHEADVIRGFQVDHVIAEKHKGLTDDHNLAWCCPFCNRAKGSDVATWLEGHLVRLYNPCIDRWSEHFILAGARLEPLTSIGQATVWLLGMNDSRRLVLRTQLMSFGQFPTAAARLVMAQA
jgi:hypothetical protein